LKSLDKCARRNTSREVHETCGGFWHPRFCALNSAFEIQQNNDGDFNVWR